MFAPFGEGPVNRTNSWRSEPPYRGTYGILSTCLVTMGLCIWTALHLNMQEHNGFYRQMGRKVGWLTIGLFAPEMVAWTAFQQHRDARRLNKRMSKASKLKRPERSPTSTLEEDPLTKAGAESVSATPHWTSVHSHYALMGGFAFEPRVFGKSFLPGSLTRLTLTVTAIEFLAINEPELISKISEEDIKDKSKASALAKTLVCLQASWFCLQCVTRVQQGLAITLLELNTFAHALCTLLIYLLWWNKPLDIEQPTIIRGEHADVICAMMVMLDYINQGPQKLYETRSLGTGLAALKYVPSEVATLSKPPVELDEEGWFAYFTRNLPSAPSEGEESGPAEGEIAAPIVTEAVVRMKDLAGYSSHKSIIYPRTMSTAGPLTLHPYQVPDETSPWSTQGVFDFPCLFGFKWTLRLNLWGYKLPTLELNLRDVICSRLAVEGMRRYQPSTSHEGFSGAQNSQRPYLNRRNGDWPSLGSVDQQGLHLHSKSILTAFIFAGLIYGGLHLFAWNATFPSPTEKTLWRSSGIILAVSGMILTVQYITPTDTGNFFYDMAAGMSVALMIFLAVLYTAARVYLVVECFINLKYLLEAAYLVPEWSRYFPHIT